jgi:hypothetical protein
LNRKALLRWLNKEWTKLGIPSHQLDIFMGDCINMCLEETEEHVALQKSRNVRKQARMTFYNHNKFVGEVIK